MKITYDKTKRLHTLKERNLDFEDAAIVFDGPVFEFEDLRFDYGEKRMVTVGYLLGRMVMIIWTDRGNARHIISMRKTNDKEQKKYRQRLN